MNWTGLEELRKKILRLWERGTIAAAMVTGEKIFPLRLTLKVPASTEIGDHFDDLRAWIADLRSGSAYRIEYREFRHRLFGTNSIPSAVWFDTVGDALALIGKQRAAARFDAVIDQTHHHIPQLLNWLAVKPLKTLDYAEQWENLLKIIIWRCENPHPGIYLRQIDIPGIHRKFIEAHRGILTELLDNVLPSDSINHAFTGISNFSVRYGFKEKPTTIRFRPLDPDRPLLNCGTDSDMALDSASFSRLNPPVSKVFITENEINFLAFPEQRDSMIIFGAGYGFEVFSQIEWLNHCQIFYWGDIDTHGFNILNQLRKYFRHTRSILMDRKTLMTFKAQWGEEGKQVQHDLARLTPEETELYNDLRDNRLGKQLRLEQEKIGFEWVTKTLEF